MTRQRPKPKISIMPVAKRTAVLDKPVTQAQSRRAETQKPARQENDARITYLGTFDGLQFKLRRQTMTFKLLDGQTKLDGRTLKAPYDPAILPFLKRMKNDEYTPTLEIRGDGETLSPNGRTVRLANITHLQTINEYPVLKQTFQSNGKSYVANPPLRYEVRMNPQNGWYEISGEPDVLFGTPTPLDFSTAIDAWLDVLWQEVINDPAHNWEPKIQELREAMHIRVTEAPHGL